MTADDVIKRLTLLAKPHIVAYNARVGLSEAKSLGIATPDLKKLAAEVKRAAPDPHALAAALWATGSYDARVIAMMIDDPRQLTDEQMESWCRDFNNWGIVDGTCCYLFCRTQLAYQKAFLWAEREPEFEKRAAFSLMAYLAVHDKRAENETLTAFFPLIEAHAWDDRNFVKKAVNWALRQLGKRNLDLNQIAIEAAQRVRQQGTPPAKWIASDALRELTSPQVRARLAAKEARAARV